MKLTLLYAATMAIVAGTAHAACYADYKAKRDDPLRLHYGVVEIRGQCSANAAAAELRPRLAEDDWQLLSIEGVFDDAGLEERRESAGAYYLRY